MYRREVLRGVLKGSYSTFTRVLEEIMGNSERLDRQALPRFQPGFFRLPVLGTEPLSHRWSKTQMEKYNKMHYINNTILNCIKLRYLLAHQKLKALRRFLSNFTFFYMQKKKVLDSRKFSTSSFRWIYMFWDVLNTIWPFLENVCLYVSKILWTLYHKN